jgi:hypothetical protein
MCIINKEYYKYLTILNLLSLAMIVKSPELCQISTINNQATLNNKKSPSTTTTTLSPSNL